MTEDKMRKAWTFALFLLIPPLSLAQQGPNRFPPINIYHGNPNGQPCTPEMSIVQSDQNGKSYTCFGAVWGPGSDGGSPTGQANNVIPLAGGPTSITKQSHIDENTAGITNVSQIMQTPTLITAAPAADIRHASFAGGAVIDGITPIDAPLAAATISACAGTNGTGTVFIPGNNGSGAYLASGAITQPNMSACATQNNIQYKLQGTLKLGSTLNIPNTSTWQCEGGSSPGQFAAAGPNCKILAPAVYGTLGTNVSANASTTVSLAFTGGSYANLPVNSAITIADLATCNITSATVSGINVVATINTQCRVPAGAKITVAGNSEASFNATPILLTSDYVAGSMQWNPSTRAWAANTALALGQIVADNTSNCALQAGTIGPTQHCLHIVTSAGTTGGSQPTWNASGGGTTTDGSVTWTNMEGTTGTGGTIVGIDDNTYESVRITANSGSSVTAYFMHAHTSAATWGEVAIAPLRGSFTELTMRGLTVTGCYGMCMWFEMNADIMLDGIGISGVQPYLSSGAMEMASSYNWHIQHSGILPTLSLSCFLNCAQTGYPYGLRITNAHNFTDSAALDMFIDGMTIIGGAIKVDTNGRTKGLDSGAGAGTKIGFLQINGAIIEQPNGAGLIIDPRFVVGTGSNFPFVLNNFFLQDNNLGYNPCIVAYTDRSTSALNPGQINFAPMMSNPLSGCVVNQYYNGQITMNGMANTGNPTFPWRAYSPLGQLNDGVTVEEELRGEGAQFSPAIVPYASLNVVTNPTSWSCVGTGCSVTPGLRDPRNTFNAGEIISGSAGNSYVQAYSFSGATNTGDHFVSGVWCIAGTGTTVSDSCSADGAFGAYNLVSFGAVSDQWDGGAGGTTSSGFCTANWRNDWWKPIVCDNKITLGSSTSHFISMRMYGPTVPGRGNRFFQPFLFYIPIGALPSTIAGSITSGTFTIGETITQATSGATAVVKASSSGSMTVNLITGTPNNSNIWTGGTSSATYTPTAVPVATMTTQQWDMEISRWRQQLLHGTVPPNMPSGALGVAQSDSLYFGSDTYVGRGSGAGKLAVNGVDLPSSAGFMNTNVPAWLQYLGDASEAAPTCTSGCAINGEHWYASFTCPAGQICYSNGVNPLIIRSTGTCTVAGTLSVSPNSGSFPGVAQASNYGGSGGGGGFGASNGAAGSTSTPNGPGTAGTSGVAGGNGAGSGAGIQKMLWSGNPFVGYASNITAGIALFGGAPGGVGQGNGTAAAKGAGMVVLDCATVNFTGTIDASGVNGAAGGSNIGGNGGSGGGLVIVRSPNMTNSGTINTAGGTGGAIGTGTSTKGGDGGQGFSKVFSQ